MPSKKRSRRSEPKVFRCTGFGDCNMVFTRSEHLARHARKHTGEKPFKCIVPGCDRMFSRFDNMMQHTHTHERQKKRSSVGPAAAPATAPAVATSAIATAPPQPSHGNGNKTMLQSRTLPPPLAPPKSPEKQRQHHYHVFASPPTKFPALPQPWEHQQCHPYQQQYYHPYQQHPTATTRTPMLSPPLSFTPPPEQHPMYATDFYPVTRKSLSIEEPKERRRLSLIDLQTPIDHWSEHPTDEESDDSSTIEVTLDEYEAILGFGRFCAQPYTKPSSDTGDEIHSPPLLPSFCPWRPLGLDQERFAR